MHRKKILKLSSISLVILLLVGLVFYINDTYTVKTVYIEGNIHYTDLEIMDMVMTGKYGKSSIYLSFVYKNKEIEDIPFVEAIEVSILSPDTIRIQVYEKALAGYVTYLGKHMYFDKDGIVVENSDIITPGIPEVSGLEFDYIILHEPLPVEDKKIFKDILSVTQMLQKYEVSCDKLSFNSQKQMTLYMGDVKVSLGSTLNLNEKIMELPYLIPSLAGKKGTLRMENFTQENDYITFDVEN